ncbi:hypothetical protein BX257_4050 [Streptomyces sp. 3212.3]|uniref:hypothetical protein n=1 Tax=Streptomyces sp. 3212.3 TaxID=1938846 RepID=UPI000E383059|nr:hypothetical protein [Streptomyces sp. 3212.3]REE61471.1 hypothetical protein BX257_4050 [Streptomyces sp. 3212.3]
MQTRERAQHVMAAITSAVQGEHERASALMAHIAQRSTGNEMYGVCCAIAEAARKSLHHLYGHQHPNALWALAAPDPDDGPEHPAHVFAKRFITAFLNEDQPTCQALYLAAAKASGEDYAHSVIALLGDAALLVRYATSQPHTDDEPSAAHPH